MKPFDPSGCLYDMKTYWGRVSHFLDLCDLRNALLSDGDIRAAQSLLAEHKRGAAPPGTTDAQLWEAKKRA
jgi:hypothetical protein